MFRRRSPQRDLFASSQLMPEQKRARLKSSWAEVFRREALKLIDEEEFADLYSADNGRPNRAVETILGVLILKEMFDLTDAGALDALEYNLQWHHALDLTMEEAHLPQKTLHNFRARLMAADGGKAAFVRTTDRILEALGTDVSRQRLDSTHVMSNMAVLTRLGLFCETIRVFLHALEKAHPALYATVPQGLRGRYIKSDGTDNAYEDARSKHSRRRLEVCARDVYRLCSRFEETEAAELESYGLLQRLLEEQCAVGVSPQPPGEEEDDAGEDSVPVILKAEHNISSASMQSPHDPDATYSGHKGKGYEVQVSETCSEKNTTQIITHVEVTDACAHDGQATVPVLQELDKREVRPSTLIADTSYGSAENGLKAEAMGTELVSPVGGSAGKGETVICLTAAEFDLDEGGHCPAGHAPTHQTVDEKDEHLITLFFDPSLCETCALRTYCPVRRNAKTGENEIRVDARTIHLARRRRDQTREDFQVRYAPRAGIEGTNSEMKRAHGLGHLRVRGRLRVVLAVYMKALGCNMKRMVCDFLKAEQALARAAA